MAVTPLGGDEPAVLYDRHAAGLYRLACAVLGSRSAAEDVVVDVMSQACAHPPSAASAASPGLPVVTGCELARRVIGRCQASAYPPGRDITEGPAAGTAAWALCTVGGCTVQETAAVLGLRESRVHALLRHELTPRHPRESSD